MNNPFNFFDKIFCINLDERQDRWKECCYLFNKYDIMHKIERFPALKFNHQDPRLMKAMGQIGCSMSHYAVTRKAKEQNLKNYLVLEDDFYFEYNHDELFGKINNCINQLPNDWDMFYLGGNLDASYNKYPIEKYSENLFKLNSCHTTHAFAVNNKLYDIILKDEPNYETLPTWYNNYTVIDVYFCKNILSQNNCYISNPILSLQRPGFSNIEHNSYDYRAWMLQNFENYKNNLT